MVCCLCSGCGFGVEGGAEILESESVSHFMISFLLLCLARLRGMGGVVDEEWLLMEPEDDDGVCWWRSGV